MGSRIKGMVVSFGRKKSRDQTKESKIDRFHVDFSTINRVLLPIGFGKRSSSSVRLSGLAPTLSALVCLCDVHHAVPIVLVVT